MLVSLLVAALLHLPVAEAQTPSPLDTASLRAALAPASLEPVELRTSLDGQRLTCVRGAFFVAAPDPDAALRLFLRDWGPRLGLLTLEADWRLMQTRQTPAGVTIRMQQLAGGLPVFGGEMTALLRVREGGHELRSLSVGELPVGDSFDPNPSLSATAALERARSSVDMGDGALRAPDAATLGWSDGLLVWRVRLSPVSPVADWEVLVDAHCVADGAIPCGAILSTTDRIRRFTGTGWVFSPNPVATSGNTQLDDDDDADSDALLAELYEVDLNHLDGSGYLTGDFADTDRQRSSDRALESDLAFFYTRSDDHFEEVMAYHAITVAQERIQSLGFTDSNARSQRINVNADSSDNSYYSPGDRSMNTGTGGVDDAEDAEILWHEYGHAVLDDVIPDFGYGYESAALGEGFGDYQGSSFSQTIGHTVADPYCLGDWDAVSYSRSNPPCLRRVDSAYHYPERISTRGDYYTDSTMWSSALMSIWNALGADVADSLVYQAQYAWTTREGFLDAASSIIDADKDLFGGVHEQAIRGILVAQGLSRDLASPLSDDRVVGSEIVDIRPPVSESSYRDHEDDTQTFRSEGAGALRVHFVSIDTQEDGQCLDEGCDNIYLTGGDGLLYQILHGRQSDLDSVVIPGDTVNIRLVADGSSGGTGYVVDRVDIIDGMVTGETGVSDTAVGDTGHEEVVEEDLKLSGCGCSSVGARSGWGFGLIGLLGLVRRRRGSTRWSSFEKTE